MDNMLGLAQHMQLRIRRYSARLSELSLMSILTGMAVPPPSPLTMTCSKSRFWRCGRGTAAVIAAVMLGGCSLVFPAGHDAHQPEQPLSDDQTAPKSSSRRDRS